MGNHEHFYQYRLQLQGGPPIRHYDGGVGHRRHGPRGFSRGSIGLARTQFRFAVDQFRAPAPIAHQRGDLCFWRLRAVRQLVLLGAAHLPDTIVRTENRRILLLGLASRDSAGGHQPAAGLHQFQGIRRTGMADRHSDHHCLGRLRGGVLRHDHAAQDQTHLRRQLVFRGVHHHRGDSAHRQQPRAAGELHQILFGVRRGDRRHGAVVVRAQRCRLFPHCRVPRDDVLLRAETGRAPGVFLSLVDRAFLGADHPVHLGRPAPFALYRAAGLGAVTGHGDVADPAGTKLGRDDQRDDDALGRLA